MKKKTRKLDDLLQSIPTIYKYYGNWSALTQKRLTIWITMKVV